MRASIQISNISNERTSAGGVRRRKVDAECHRVEGSLLGSEERRNEERKRVESFDIQTCFYKIVLLTLNKDLDMLLRLVCSEVMRYNDVPEPTTARLLQGPNISGRQDRHWEK